MKTYKIFKNNKTKTSANFYAFATHFVEIKLEHLWQRKGASNQSF